MNSVSTGKMKESAPIVFGAPTDPTRSVINDVEPSAESIYQSPVTDQQFRRSPVSAQVGFEPGGLNIQ